MLTKVRIKVNIFIKISMLSFIPAKGLSPRRWRPEILKYLIKTYGYLFLCVCPTMLTISFLPARTYF